MFFKYLCEVCVKRVSHKSVVIFTNDMSDEYLGKGPQVVVHNISKTCLPFENECKSFDRLFSADILQKNI